MKKFTSIVLAIILILLIGWVLYEFILFFQETEKDIKAALIGVFGVTVAALCSHYFAQKREMASRQFSQKAKAYEGIFDLIFEIMKEVKAENKMTQEEMLRRMIAIKRDMMIWAGNDVLKAWANFESEASKGDNANVFKSMEKVFRALRKELGHRDVTLAEGDLVKWIVQQSDHHMVDEQMRKR